MSTEEATIGLKLPSVHIPDELTVMAKACRIVADAIQLVGRYCKPGISTIELDAIAEDYIRGQGGTPAFKGYQPWGMPTPFPGTLCISIDNEVVHGIPSEQILKAGMIVSIDCGVQYDGYFGDSAFTFAVGEISEQKQNLLDVTQQSLQKAIEVSLPGNKLYEISRAVEKHVVRNGFSCVRDLSGHGIGKELHEEPSIPNFVPGLLHRNRYPNVTLTQGKTLAIEPMVNEGTFTVHTAADGWTIVTADGKNSAHFEHTIVVNKGGAIILTEY